MIIKIYNLVISTVILSQIFAILYIIHSLCIISQNTRVIDRMIRAYLSRLCVVFQSSVQQRLSAAEN